MSQLHQPATSPHGGQGQLPDGIEHARQRLSRLRVDLLAVAHETRHLDPDRQKHAQDNVHRAQVLLEPLWREDTHQEHRDQGADRKPKQGGYQQEHDAAGIVGGAHPCADAVGQQRRRAECEQDDRHRWQAAQQLGCHHRLGIDRRYQ